MKSIALKKQIVKSTSASESLMTLCLQVLASVPGKQMCPSQFETARMSENSEMGVMGYKGVRVGERGQA